VRVAGLQAIASSCRNKRRHGRFRGTTPDLDREYLARWVSRLGLDALYREVGG
jgi:hypothetical protein